MTMPRGKRLWQLLAMLVVIAMLAGGWRWYRESQHWAETDNAYVNADIGQISALVAGQVEHVHVRDNQLVHKGDPLFDIDRRPFEVALQKAEAKLAQARQTTRQDNADVGAARAELVRAKASLDNAESKLARSQQLVAQKFLSQQALDDARANARTESAGVAAAQAKLRRAQATEGGIDANPDVLQARAEIAQARLDLEHTDVVAPADGWITNFSLVAGSNVMANAAVAALIVDGSFWVDANFKETQLASLHPGQPADIVVDMYPDKTLHGSVASISGGTGTAFSLLPPQNATGNWVKVTQRVPVKIRITDSDPQYPLRVGATAAVKIRVR